MKTILLFTPVLLLSIPLSSSEHRLNTNNQDSESYVNSDAQTSYTPGLDDAVIVNMADGVSPNIEKQQIESSSPSSSILAPRACEGNDVAQLDVPLLSNKAALERQLTVFSQEVQNSVHAILELQQLNNLFQDRIDQLELDHTANSSEIRSLQAQLFTVRQELKNCEQGLRKKSNCFFRRFKDHNKVCYCLSSQIDEKDPEDQV